jgi:prolyl 4-hydroxylase
MHIKNYLLLSGAAAGVVMWLDYLRVKEERKCRRPVEHLDFLTDAECAAVIKAALARGLERSEITGTAGGEVSTVRTSHQVFLEHEHPAVEPVIAKAESLLGCSRKHFEQLQVVRYRPGQKYDAHYDSDSDTPRDDLRTDTLLMYLNDVESGGHTEFPKLKTSVTPRKGKAVHWKNVDSRGHVLPCAYHGGRPVEAGTKWICTVWKRL